MKSTWKVIENHKQKHQMLKKNLALSIKQTEQIKTLLEQLGKQSNTILINADKCVKEKHYMILKIQQFNTQIREMQQESKRNSYRIQKETIKIKEQQNRINFISKFQGKLIQQNQKYLSKKKQLEKRINTEKQLQEELQAEMKLLLDQNKKNTKQIEKNSKNLAQSQLILTSRTNQNIKEDQSNISISKYIKFDQILQEVHNISRLSQLQISQSTIKQLELTHKKQFQIIDKLQAEKFKYEQIVKKKQLQKQSCQRKKQVLGQKLKKLKNQICQIQKSIIVNQVYTDKENIPSQSNKIVNNKHISQKQKNIEFYQAKKNNLLEKKSQICQRGKSYAQWVNQISNKTKSLSQLDQNLLKQKKVIDEISKKMFHTKKEVSMIAKYSFENEQ